MGDLKGKYYVKKTAGGTYADVTTLVDGVRVLKIEGFLSLGKPVNIYTAQWQDSQSEDFMITKETTSGGVTTPVVIRENSDIEITFIVKQKYATNTINVMTQHDTFVNYLTGSDVWVKSEYVGGKGVHCVCLSEYSPTTVKLQRGTASWVMGTIKLHMLEAPSSQ